MTFSATKHIELFQRCFMDTLNTKVELLATVRPAPAPFIRRRICQRWNPPFSVIERALRARTKVPEETDLHT